MSTPHDYYDCRENVYGNNPHLHSKGHSWPYTDPDYVANETDDQLPVISCVGTGPRGEGITAEISADYAGVFKFKVRSDLTNEVIFESPNLSAGQISIEPDDDPEPAGAPTHFTVRINRGPGDIRAYRLMIPCGEPGTRLYLVTGDRERIADNVYRFPVSMLKYENALMWNEFPMPRCGDVAAFKIYDVDSEGEHIEKLMMGYIDAVWPIDGVDTITVVGHFALPVYGSGGSEYVLPVATSSVLGGVKIGSGLSITSSGVLSANGYTLPKASASTLGGVKVGSGLSITSAGVLSANGYTLPKASASTLGGIKVGQNLTIDADGTLNAQGGGTPYVLPVASASTLGGIKVGSNLTIDSDGKLSAQLSSEIHGDWNEDDETDPTYIENRAWIRSGDTDNEWHRNAFNAVDSHTFNASSANTNAFGQNNTVGGTGAAVFGSGSIVNGISSFGAGAGINCSQDYSACFGNETRNMAQWSLVAGSVNRTAADRDGSTNYVFQIGNSISYTSRSDAIRVRRDGALFTGSVDAWIGCANANRWEGMPWRGSYSKGDIVWRGDPAIYYQCIVDSSTASSFVAAEWRAIDAVRPFPYVTAADAGKVLMVDSNGFWTAGTIS